MISTQGLRFQINLRIALSILGLLLFGGGAAIWQARHAVREEVQASINLALQLVRLGVEQSGTAPVTHQDWLQKITALRATRHISVQIQTLSGQTVSVNNTGNREQDAPLPPSWFIATVASDYPQAVYALTGPDGLPLKIVIRADPLDEIAEAWAETRLYCISIVLLLALIFLAVNLVFNKALQSVATIMQGLQAIEEGRYRQKLPVFSAAEFTTIAHGINHLASALAEAQRENSALASHSLEIQEEERQHLAQELHDEFGQSLTAIKVMAVTSKQPGVDQLKISSDIAAICDHLFNVVRSMMRTLHPLALTELGLRAALDDLADQWRIRHPYLNLCIDCDPAVEALESKLPIQLFRIIQECLTNVVRHADAREVHVALTLSRESDAEAAGTVSLVVQDDGKGCDLREINGGFGLLGMRERVRSLGGEFELQSEPRHGMCIRARIPYTRSVTHS